jgi:DNA-binding transcriptional LysR family regulator
MELRSLKFAVTLAEELHFGRAAERHFVSAQPFGRTIAALEREIGTPLFNRTTRRVELTPAGTSSSAELNRCSSTSRSW